LAVPHQYHSHDGVGHDRAVKINEKVNGRNYDFFAGLLACGRFELFQNAAVYYL
jgi:hypothetical protein